MSNNFVGLSLKRFHLGFLRLVRFYENFYDSYAKNCG